MKEQSQERSQELAQETYQRHFFHQTSVGQLVSGLLHGRKASYKEQFGTVGNRNKRCACTYTSSISPIVLEVAIVKHVYGTLASQLIEQLARLTCIRVCYML
jgi:hypothetical protein